MRENFYELELCVEFVLSGDFILLEELGFFKIGCFYNKYVFFVVYVVDWKFFDFIWKFVLNENKVVSNVILLRKSVDLR